MALNGYLRQEFFMELQDLINRRRVVLDMKATDRWAALDEVLSVLFPDGGPECDAVRTQLRNAELKRCSAVGRTVTILHCIVEKAKGIKIALGISRKGIPWNAPDGRVINLIWLMVHPESEQQTYLRLLAQAMRVCRDPDNRRKLVNAATADDVKAVIAEASTGVCSS